MEQFERFRVLGSYDSSGKFFLYLSVLLSILRDMHGSAFGSWKRSLRVGFDPWPSNPCSFWLIVFLRGFPFLVPFAHFFSKGLEGSGTWWFSSLVAIRCKKMEGQGFLEEQFRLFRFPRSSSVPTTSESWEPKASFNSKESSKGFARIFWTNQTFYSQNEGFWEEFPQKLTQTSPKLGKGKFLGIPVLAAREGEKKREKKWGQKPLGHHTKTHPIVAGLSTEVRLMKLANDVPSTPGNFGEHVFFFWGGGSMWANDIPSFLGNSNRHFGAFFLGVVFDGPFQQELPNFQFSSLALCKGRWGRNLIEGGKSGKWNLKEKSQAFCPKMGPFIGRIDFLPEKGDDLKHGVLMIFHPYLSKWQKAALRIFLEGGKIHPPNIRQMMECPLVIRG